MRVNIDASVFNPHFLPMLMDDEHFILLLVGGGGSGKSYFSFQRCIVRCLMEKRKFLVLRKTAVDVRKSCWADVTSILSSWNLRSIVKVNQTSMTITFPNESMIMFSGLDDSERIKSIPNITDIIVEEASEINFEDFSQIKQRLRGSGRLKNQIVLQSNPVSKANWLYKHFFEGGNSEPDCLIDRSTYRDNPHLNQNTIDVLEGYKHTNSYFYRVYCLGEWGSLSKQIYTNYVVEDLDIEDLRSRNLTHLVGLDFGFVVDPTAIVQSLLDEENKTIYIIDEFYQTGLLNNEIADVLKVRGLTKSTIIADSAEQKSIEEIKRCGVRRILPSKKGKDSINQGIQKLQQYQLIVDRSCTNTIEELENYA